MPEDWEASEPSSSVLAAQKSEPTTAVKIGDLTEQDLVNLRRTIYLTIMSSLDFEECAHKLMRLDLAPGQEIEIVNMLLECCMQERTYVKMFGLLAERFCLKMWEYRDE